MSGHNELQERIRQLEQENESLKKDKRQLLSVVSHDIKSPFNQVYALTNLFLTEKDNLNDNQLEYIARIQQSVSDGLFLIRNLMDIRSLEGDGIRLNLAELSLGQVISKCIRSFTSSANRKNISFDTQSQIKDTLIYFDELYLSRIVENILSNALKFSPINGTIKILIKDQSNDKVLISITDQGAGISESDMPQLFQKFRVLSSEPTGSETSSGLGLFVAKSMADRVKTNILIKSSSAGTRVDIVVPRNFNQI